MHFPGRQNFLCSLIVSLIYNKCLENRTCDIISLLQIQIANDPRLIPFFFHCFRNWLLEWKRYSAQSHAAGRPLQISEQIPLPFQEILKLKPREGQRGDSKNTDWILESLCFNFVLFYFWKLSMGIEYTYRSHKSKRKNSTTFRTFSIAIKPAPGAGSWMSPAQPEASVTCLSCAASQG